MILFFWLLIIHSISSSDIIAYDQKRFYLPKIVICGLIWVNLMFSTLYSIVFDTTFQWNKNYDLIASSYTHIFTIILFLGYISYLVIIAYMAVASINDMRKAYRFVLIMTLVVIIISIILFLTNGFSST